MPAADQMTAPRRSLLNFRASATEREQLQRLAAAQGTTLSDLIRQGLELRGFKPER